MLARLGALALTARTSGEATELAFWEHALLPLTGWPQTRLVVVAIDAVDGSRAGLDRTADVPLGRAVAASAALPILLAPITIGDRRYIDGGLGSQTNADLTRGAREVLIVAPAERGRLARKVEMLRGDGTEVRVIRPSPASRMVLGQDLTLLDLGRRARTAQAGYEDGKRAGELFAGKIAPDG
ncbi:MAG TPA: patatin-like phospholipase family protein [Candidatus Limnocylindrales bacterium]